MIRYSETFEIWDDEAREIGDTDYKGFVDDDASCDFADMVRMLRGAHPSSGPLPYNGRATFYTTNGDDDIRTGKTDYRAYHPATARAARYMAKAWRVANQR